MSNTETARPAMSAYLDALGRTLRLGTATEPSYYPYLQAFLEALAPGITATTNPKRIACGAPDVAISRPTAHGQVTSGYIEAKEPGAPLDTIEQSEQLQRYRTLPNLLLTDFLTFRWYVDGARRQEARLGRLDSSGRLRRGQRGRASTGYRVTRSLPRPCAGAGQRSAGTGRAPGPTHAPHPRRDRQRAGGR